ncbi:hypothetical protein BH11MYX4_BH11MYX4_66890 [soil metagenome]
MDPGRAAAYRGGVIRCPWCGDLMRAEPTRTSEPQVCDGCDGLWIDWFEGEVSAIAVEKEAARVQRGTPLPSRPSRPPAGTGACPHCARALVAELYRFADAKDDELITGVELLRCPECAGAFVPRGSAHLLLERSREAKTQTPMEAIRALVRQTFGRR